MTFSNSDSLYINWSESVILDVTFFILYAKIEILVSILYTQFQIRQCLWGGVFLFLNIFYTVLSNFNIPYASLYLVIVHVQYTAEPLWYKLQKPFPFGCIILNLCNKCIWKILVRTLNTVCVLECHSILQSF